MWCGDRKYYTEFIKLYESLPCLWDQNHLYYKNKDARNKAQKLLHEKFLEFNEGAPLSMMKKRLDNMRTCCAREVRKVLAAKAAGENYQPSLWYFEKMSFLYRDYKIEIFQDNNSDTEINSESHVTDDVEEKEEIFEILLPDSEDYEPDKKKRKRSSVNRSSIYAESNKREELVAASTSASSTFTKNISCEIESHGHTIGLQLKELDDYQRYIAEKLISEVIFRARLKTLTPESSIKH